MEQQATWLLSKTGQEIGGCCVQASPRDYARMGQFILNGATVNGQSIVPDDWWAQATTKQADIGTPGRGYGYQWWCMPGAEHRYSAEGIHGQFVFVDPGTKVVVVAMSAWPEAWDEAKAAEAFTFFAAVANSLR